MKKQMTLGTQVTIGFLVALVLLAVIGYWARHAIGGLGGQLNSAVNVTAREAEFVGELNTGFQEMKEYAIQTQFSFVMTHLARTNPSVGAALECAMCHTEEARDVRQRGLDAIAGKVRTTISKLQPMMAGSSGNKSLDQLQTGLRDYQSMFGEYLVLVEGNRYDDAHAVLRDRMLPSITEMGKLLEGLRAEQRSELDLTNQQGIDTVARSQRLTLLLIGAGLLLTAGVLLLVRRTTRSLRRMGTDLERMACEVASAASQVSASSQSLAQTASEQAASLEETSASTEEIDSMARRNTENSRGATDLVTATQQMFAQTNQLLDQSVVAMGEIKTQSGRISAIIRVIDEIAFQTNILALNAAVEAARAGEAGMGFAVVADEVRNLAQRCSQAAKDTSSLIEETIDKSNDGKCKVDQVAAAIRTIFEKSAELKTLVDEMNLGSREQTHGIQQIGKAISQMEQVTQTTAANAEESAAAAEELNAQSGTLKEVVERLAAVVGRESSEGGGIAEAR
jgi:methyl-accepting chemotaxis protein/methyl-accepting chemotaxis protein-1 (serine sensor receptor)